MNIFSKKIDLFAVYSSKIVNFAALKTLVFTLAL